MVAMLLDRLRKGLLRLQGTYGVEFTDSVYYGAPFQALLTLVIEDLHQLYPAYIPPGRRYQFLQHLAVLDLQLQQVATQPTYLDNVANRHHLRQVLIAALDYTLQYSQSDAV